MYNIANMQKRTNRYPKEKCKVMLTVDEYAKGESKIGLHTIATLKKNNNKML